MDCPSRHGVTLKCGSGDSVAVGEMICLHGDMQFWLDRRNDSPSTLPIPPGAARCAPDAVG